MRLAGPQWMAMLVWPLAAADFSTEVRPILQQNCLGCHSGASAQGSIDLSTREGVLKTVTAGEPGKSRLYLAVAHQGPKKMPLGKPQLAAAEIARIGDWIGKGAEYASARHWSFEKPVRPAEPRVRNRAWVRNPIDAFVAREHERQSLTPAPEADKRTLLRRVTLDLTGVPPTAEEMRRFLADNSASAYERVVDRLLASQRHGERWGRHWMDVWRYSDWYGYRRSNEVRHSQRHVWQWRDWIVEAINNDRPYDRMVMEMLAGDEIAPTDPKVLRATGFLVRNYNRYDRDGWMQDVVDHTATAFLGVTLKCARCHDHKYDPFSQKDYYSLRAFFEPYSIRLDRVPGEPDTEKAGLARAFDAKAATPTYLYIGGDVQNPDKAAVLGPAVPAVLGKAGAAEPVAIPLEARYPDIREFVHTDLINAARRDVAKAESASARDAAEARLKALEARIAADRAKHLGSSGVEELAKVARRLERNAYVLTAADDLARAQQKFSDALKATKPDGEVDEKKISAAKAELDKAQSALAKKPESYSPIGETYPDQSSGRRLALARWIANGENPLTARVAVNHIWARHFGQGLVPTVHDFGQYGKPPSHPELLDWLATEFASGNWNMKRIHRLIVTSSAYRLASSGNEANEKLDSANRFLWRMNQRRMEAEAVRDSVLFAAGQLDAAMGGPEIEETREQDSARRSLYLRQAPDLRAEFLSQFDAADPNECYRRNESIIPQQALSLANSRLSLDQSRRLAATLPAEGFVEAAFETVLNRPPTAEERDHASSFLHQQAQLLAEPAKLKPFETGVASAVKPAADPVQRAREGLVHVLFNLNEFVTIR